MREPTATTTNPDATSPPATSPTPRNLTAAKLAAVAAVAVVAAACGGSDDTSNEATPEVVVQSGESADDGEVIVLSDAESSGGAESVGDGDAAAVVDEGTQTNADGGTGDEPAAESTDEEIALAFAQCMRDEGIDWPDPVTNADGSIDLSGGIRPGANGFDDTTQAALEACGPIIEGASFLPGGGNGLDAETQDTFLEFTECLRDQGLDVDDPDFGDLQPGGGGGGLFGENFDPQDPANADAIEACQDIFAGAFGG